MEGRMCPEGMSPQQFAEAQRIMEVTEQATQDERWRMACLLASKKDGEMLGQSEFQLREHVHRIGATTLEAAVNERRKKGATAVLAVPAPARSMAAAATTTQSSSAGGREPL